MLQAITQDFTRNKTKFEGSIEWHMEWVKLDMEARKEIVRKTDKSPIRYSVVKENK